MRSIGHETRVERWNAFKRAIRGLDSPRVPRCGIVTSLRQLRLSDRLRSRQPRCLTIIVIVHVSRIRSKIRKNPIMPFCNHFEERNRSTFAFNSYRFDISRRKNLSRTSRFSRSLNEWLKDFVQKTRVKMERSILTVCHRFIVWLEICRVYRST